MGGRKQQGKHKIKQRCQWNACRWRHHQALFVSWKIMVHPVKNEMNALSPRRRRVVMKNKPVENVFSCRPNEEAQGKIEKETGKANAAGNCLVNKKENRRDLDKQRNGKMDF